MNEEGEDREEEEDVEEEGVAEEREVQEAGPGLSVADTLAQKVNVSTPITLEKESLSIDSATKVLYEEFKRRGYKDDLGKILCDAFKEWAKTPRKGWPGLEVAIVESE